jgi:cytochrome P450
LGQVRCWGSRDLSEAVILWTGWKHAAWPSRDESRVVQRFGADVASGIMSEVYKLESDFYSSDARHIARDLATMGEIASDQFRERHPEIEEEAVRALSWCYTFDYK